MPNPNFTVIVDDMDLDQRYKSLWLVIAEGRIGKVSRGGRPGRDKIYRDTNRDAINARARTRYASKKHSS